MKTTVMVVDTLLRFSMLAILPFEQPPQAWEMQVITINEVAAILLSLGLLDSKAAAMLTEGGTSITPQPGLTTLPVENLAAAAAVADPDFNSVSQEAQQGYLLIARGETTEEALASAGFVLKRNSPVQ